MNNLLSYFGLIDAKIRASDKDLPVHHFHLHLFSIQKYNFLTSPKNDEKRSRKNYFEIPPCLMMVTFVTEFVIWGKNSLPHGGNSK